VRRTFLGVSKRRSTANASPDIPCFIRLIPAVDEINPEETTAKTPECVEVRLQAECFFMDQDTAAASLEQAKLFALRRSQKHIFFGADIRLPLTRAVNIGLTAGLRDKKRRILIYHYDSLAGELLDHCAHVFHAVFRR